MPHLYAHCSSLLSAPSSVLLYGPPGCGKTMLAKALAHESGACFINLHISTLTEKWYGDSNKLVNAVFSLARKLQPSIVFIDEIDAVLGQRRSGEHEASGMVKAEYVIPYINTFSVFFSISLRHKLQSTIILPTHPVLVPYANQYQIHDTLGWSLVLFAPRIYNSSTYLHSRRHKSHPRHR